MKILRTILWVLAAFGFVIFAFYNWNRVELTLWQNLVLETPLPALVLVVFALGFVPMWALHRSVAWNLRRRIRALEASLKNTATARQREAEAQAAMPLDDAVDNSGKTGGNTPDLLSPAQSGTDGDSGK